MSDLIRKLGAYGIIGTVLGGIMLSAFAKISSNEVEIARLKERNAGLKEIVIKIETNVEFIRRKVENI